MNRFIQFSKLTLLTCCFTETYLFIYRTEYINLQMIQIKIKFNRKKHFHKNNRSLAKLADFSAF